MRVATSGPVRRLLQEWEKLQIENGLLYRKTLQRRQLVVPEKYRSVALKYLHDEMGHVGTERVVSHCKRPFLLAVYEERDWGLHDKKVPMYKTQETCGSCQGTHGLHYHYLSP